MGMGHVEYRTGRTAHRVHRDRDEIGAVDLSSQLGVHCNFVRDGEYSKKGVGLHPPPSPPWANFSIMMECTPESGR